MSIASLLSALRQDIINARSKITEKGGTVTSGGGSSQLADDIESIPAQKEEQSKSMTLGSAAPSTVTPDSGKALSSVVPSIDSSVIKAENIKVGVLVLGVTGSHEGAKTEQSKSMTLGSSAPVTVTPDSGMALSSVTPSIDTSVIKAENIAEGVTMLGIAGTHSGGGGSKYGATVDDFLNDLTASGVYDPPTTVSDTEIVFTGMKILASSNNYTYIFAYKFARSAAKKITFPDLKTINCQNAFQYAFTYGLTEEIDFPSFTTASLSAPFYYAFAYCKAKKISFGALTLANKQNMFLGAFQYTGNSNSDPVTIEFPELTTISGGAAFSNAFRCTYLGYGTLHPFPKLTTIGASSTLTTVFANTNCIRYIFDKLTAVSYTNTFTLAWNYSNPGSSAYDETHGIMFPMLETIGVSGSTSVYRCFPSCCLSSNNKMNGYFSSLTAIYNNHTTASNGHFVTCGMVKVFMPKLTALGSKPEYTFYNSTTITEMHFGIENQATIEAITGYSSKFGASSATIYFDLANHLTINGVVYDRDGSTDDYDNWYFGFTNNGVTYYIDNYYGAVGNVAYIKSGDTYTASGYTVSAVA